MAPLQQRDSASTTIAVAVGAGAVAALISAATDYDATVAGPLLLAAAAAAAGYRSFQKDSGPPWIDSHDGIES